MKFWNGKIALNTVSTRYPRLLFSAVVAAPSDRWGERPVAFVVLKDSNSLDAESVLRHCRNMLAGYKVEMQVFYKSVLLIISFFFVDSVLILLYLSIVYQKQGTFYTYIKSISIY